MPQQFRNTNWLFSPSSILLWRTILNQLSAKCAVFSFSARWCGCMLCRDGIRFDSRHLDGIWNMFPLSRGAEEQQFVCAMQWIRSQFPDFLRWFFCLPSLFFLSVCICSPASAPALLQAVYCSLTFIEMRCTTSLFTIASWLWRARSLWPAMTYQKNTSF